MKLFESESDSPMVETCAAAVMDTVPLVMRIIRAEMRSHRTPDLSVPQFRALLYVNRHAGASLSDVAEHLGLTLPSVSKLVDKLVARRLITRESAPEDRRRMILTLTPDGQAALQAAAQATQTRLANLLSTLSPDELTTIVEAMTMLHRVFLPDPASQPSER
jgi:DNA-binding MarR family transcriptional regulator